MDGNFAFPAGVSEMLLQSHAGLLHLLPALPKDWPAGKVAGLRARGNFTVDLEWKDGTLARAALVSHSGGPCTLRYRDRMVDLKTEPGKRYALSPELQHIE
jgi:alpha-L-fucosidase 2